MINRSLRTISEIELQYNKKKGRKILLKFIDQAKGAKLY